MSPLDMFKSVCLRCEELRALYLYLAGTLTSALKPDELLRAEWVARVSALDLYVHELVAQRMLEIFDGTRQVPVGFRRFQISHDTLLRVRSASTPLQANAAFDLEIRTRMGILSFQDPEKIADGVRLISDVELWNEIALADGAAASAKNNHAKSLKKQLSAIVDRRNKIAHEGDLQPGIPRLPNPISLQDLQIVASFVDKVVLAIDAVT